MECLRPPLYGGRAAHLPRREGQLHGGSRCLGGWSQSGSTRERHYIDPSITPSPGAYALLGWLLDGDYSSGPTERLRIASAHARADPGEP